MALRTASSAAIRRLRHLTSSSSALYLSSHTLPTPASSLTSFASCTTAAAATAVTTTTSNITTRFYSTEKKNDNKNQYNRNSSSSTSTPSSSKKQRPSGFIERLLKPDDLTGESPVLRMLGYYSAESKAIGAANSMYSQIRQRATSVVKAEYPFEEIDVDADADADDRMILTQSDFLPHFEMMALHMYLTLRRLRQESGSGYEGDVKMAMQTLFDNFWTDVRHRMMIEEHKLTLLQSGKWIKQCEKNFFGMALAFDEAWDSTTKFRACIETHITTLNKDQKKINRFFHYMQRERARLDKVPIEQIWQGTCWDSEYRQALV